jgi:hypothetical protein
MIFLNFGIIGIQMINYGLIIKMLNFYIYQLYALKTSIWQ